jgi:GntR family transcriptional repressor for pyruvate dehydrogenase complex
MSELIKLTEEERFKTGERFPSERELAKQLGVGRNVLREAMIALEGMGIIEKRERRGVFVRPHITDDVMNNLHHMRLPPFEFMPMQMEVRMMICVPAVEMAALRRTDYDLEKLWQCFDEFSKAGTSSNDPVATSAKWEALLHHLETEAAHNYLLSRINEGIASMVERNNAFVHHQIIALDDKWFEHIRVQHRTIISAVENRNPGLAGQTLKEHLIDSYEAMKKNYPKYPMGEYQIYWEAMGKQP